MKDAIITEHKLSFFACPDALAIFFDGLQRFKVGTVSGQYGFTKNEIFILSIVNDNPGNGHLNDVFQWFEYSCNQHNLNFLILEFMNDHFYLHCLKKRGFIPLDVQGQNLIKVFDQAKYIKLKQEGNELLYPKTSICRP